MPFAPFGLLTSVGAGRHNRRRDAFDTRQTLGRLGYVKPRAGAREDAFDFGLDHGLRRFQRDNGLKVDGWLAPGGETERALKRATAPRPARTPWPDPFAPAEPSGATGSKQRDDTTFGPERPKADPFNTAKPKRSEDPLGVTKPRRPSPKRVLPGINLSAGRNDAAEHTPPIRPERPASDHPGTVFNTQAKRPDAPEAHTPPIRRPVTAASRAKNGRLVDALTRTSNPGHVPDYIVEALSRGGERAIADVADLFEQYAARHQRGARRLAWEVRRRAKDVDGVRRRLGVRHMVVDRDNPVNAEVTVLPQTDEDMDRAVSLVLFDLENPSLASTDGRPQAVADGDGSRNDGAKQADKPEIPVVNDPGERTRSILDGSATRFEFKPNPDADDSGPPWNRPERGQEAVEMYGQTIDKMAKKHGVDADMMRAIMWFENATGHWYGLSEAWDWLGFSDTVMPMNINPEIWAPLLGESAVRLDDPARNIEAAAILVKRIGERLENPTPEAIGSIWNYVGRETTSDKAAHIGRIYREKPWTKTRPER